MSVAEKLTPDSTIEISNAKNDTLFKVSKYLEKVPENQIKEALIELESVVKKFLPDSVRETIQVTETKADILARITKDIQKISAKQRAEVLHQLESKIECGCDAQEFPQDERKPATRAAKRLYHNALVGAYKKRRECHEHKEPKQGAMKPYLRKIFIDASDLHELNLSHVWREKLALNGGNNKESEDSRRSIEKLAEAANMYCAIFFKPYSLHPDVASTNTLEELTAMTAVSPTTEESFQIFMSAIAKINMMHLVDTIRSQVNFKQMEALSQHLRKLIKARVRKLPNMREELFTCGNPHTANAADDNALIVKSVQVAAEKTEEAAVRKYMDKGAENTGSFAITDIQDWIRFRVVLTPEDSKNPGKTRKAVVKALGIVSALLGTDNPPDRIRYALRNGKTNGNSTGKHVAFHVTTRYRGQCGKDVKTIPVEIQIRLDMDSHDEIEDHQDYVRRKDKKNTKIAGMDVSFYDFMNDLCEMLSDEAAPLGAAKQYQEKKDQLKKIFLQIITTKNEDGEVANAKTLGELYGDKSKLGKVNILVRKCIQSKNDEISSLAQDAEKIFIDMEERYSVRQAPQV